MVARCFTWPRCRMGGGGAQRAPLTALPPEGASFYEHEDSDGAGQGGEAVEAFRMKNGPETERLFRQIGHNSELRRSPGWNWKAGARLREAAVKWALREGRLRTAADWYHAAMILHHGRTPADSLLAHERCIQALGAGEERARWLAASCEDRFLRLTRPSRTSCAWLSTSRHWSGPCGAWPGGTPASTTSANRFIRWRADRVVRDARGVIRTACRSTTSVPHCTLTV